jgi:hypothetical protein
MVDMLGLLIGKKEDNDQYWNLTELDLFAMAALQGMMHADKYLDHAWAADQAYKYANEMMKRKQIEDMGK